MRSSFTRLILARPSRAALAGSDQPPGWRLLPSSDRLGELAFAHVGAPFDVQPLGAVVELVPGVALDVHAAVALAFPFARPRVLRARVRRAHAVLLDPAAAFL